MVVTSSQNIGIQALSLDNLQGALMLWMAGMGLAFMVVLVELGIGGKRKYPVKFIPKGVYFQ